MNPRARSSRWNFWSYSNDAKVPYPMVANARKGSAYQMRRSASMRHTMRHDSANDGAISSVSITSCEAPIAFRSCAPRTGSRMRRPSTTNTMVGTAKTKNGTRQFE